VTACERCGGKHPSEGCSQSLVFQGYAFAPPYLCMCCGTEIGPVRWLEHHSCERCEWGACNQREGLIHERPLWLETTDGTRAFELYAEFLEAIPRRGRS
jgi:hypothetical protein